MKVKLTIHEKEVLRPVKLPTEIKEFDLSTWEGVCAYNAAMFEAKSEDRIIWIEKIQETVEC